MNKNNRSGDEFIDRSFNLLNGVGYEKFEELLLFDILGVFVDSVAFFVYDAV